MYSAVSCPIGIWLMILSIILFSRFDSSSADWLSWHSKVLLADVKMLTFRNGRYVKSRRSSIPHPPLRCVGGTARCKFQPSEVFCFNRGLYGDNVQWECMAEMNKDFKFSWIEVRCEGFDYPGDPYVLGGSCGLEYSINLTFRGLRRLFTREYYRGHWKIKEILTAISILIIFIALIYLLIKICEAEDDGVNDASPSKETTAAHQEGRYVPARYSTGVAHYGYYDGYYDGYNHGTYAARTYYGPVATSNANDTYTSSLWGGSSDW